MFFLTQNLSFPDPLSADADGLLALGGDLNPERLLIAYKNGIFPWYDNDPILWWCPNPRFVLFPKELKVSKTTKSLLNKNAFRFSMNTAFAEVIHNCRHIQRPDQDGTWINNEIVASFTKLHEMGYAHSAEVWMNDELVGGLYGMRIGKVFFGESMFSKVSNASRVAFTKYVEWLKNDGVELIDCQIYTEYLESFGAKMIDGADFQRCLQDFS